MERQAEKPRKPKAIKRKKKEKEKRMYMKLQTIFPACWVCVCLAFPSANRLASAAGFRQFVGIGRRNAMPGLRGWSRVLAPRPPLLASSLGHAKLWYSQGTTSDMDLLWSMIRATIASNRSDITP